jgi:O-antigen ligase
MAAIPISGARSLWDAYATLYLLLVVAQRRDAAVPKPWAWVTLAAAAGLAVSAATSGRGITSITGQVMAIASMVGTMTYVRRLYGRHQNRGLLAAACLAIGVTLHGVVRFDWGLLTDVMPSVVSNTNPWKYGVGFGVAIMLLCLAAVTRKTWVELVALALLGVVSLATGTRGLAGTLVLTFVLVIFQGVARQRSPAVRITAILVTVVAVVTMALTLEGSVANSNLASSARDRFALQAATNANPILAGRTEPPISIAAVMEHPVIGAGPNPEPTPEIISRALQIADVLGYTNPNSLVSWWTQDNQIYTHSMIMEYWVVGGVLPAILFISALILLLLGLFRSVNGRKTVPALAMFLAAQSSSDLLIAPEMFGSAAFVGLSVGVVLATSLSPLAARPSGRREVKKPSQPRSQFSVAQGLAEREFSPTN